MESMPGAVCWLMPWVIRLVPSIPSTRNVSEEVTPPLMRTVGPVVKVVATGVLGPRQKRDDVIGVANARTTRADLKQRKGIHHLGCDGLAQLAAFGLEQRSLRLDRDRLSGVAHLEDGVNTYRLRRLDDETRTNEFLETGNGDSQF